MRTTFIKLKDIITICIGPSRTWPVSVLHCKRLFDRFLAVQSKRRLVHWIRRNFVGDYHHCIAFASRQKPLNFGGDTSLSIFHSHHKWSIRQKPGWCGKITNLIIFLHQLRVVNIYMEIYEIILLKKIRFSFLFLYSFKKIYAWILLLCCLLSYTYFPASC